jgi:hypothetical protein
MRSRRSVKIHSIVPGYASALTWLPQFGASGPSPHAEAGTGRSAADPGRAQARVGHGGDTVVVSRARWWSRGTGRGTRAAKYQCIQRPECDWLCHLCRSRLESEGAGPRNVPLAGSTSRTAHRGVANRRWVMSHTTCVLSVSGVSAHLADLVAGPAPVLGVSGRLPCPNESR